MNNIIKFFSYFSKIINIYFFGSFSPKVSEISAKEKKIINFIIKKKKKIHSKAEFLDTKFFISEISNLFELKKIRNFLRSKIALNSLFVGNRFYLIREYFSIKKNFLWKKYLPETWIGNPVPFFLDFKTSGNRLHHIYHYLKFTDFVKKEIKDYDFIFEWGGGYGSQCNLAYQANFTGTYVIYDFGELNLLQYYYLKMHEHKKIFINPKILKKNSINLYSNKKLLKSNLNKKIENSLFISCWAISESEMNVRDDFQYIFGIFTNILLGLQEEYYNIKNYNYFYQLIKMNYKKEKIYSEKLTNNFENHYYLFV